VYVDNIAVKVKSRASLLDNLALVSYRLCLTRTMLNLDKCVFRITAGKLLGFLISYRGIEANPEKIRIIKAMQPPARIKDVQKLTGCLAALRRFISRLAKWALPFFKLSAKIWTEDVEEAFQELKKYLTSPLVMVAPESGEPLLLYITATSEAVSMMLVAKRPNLHNTHELGSFSTDGSGSQDPGPVEEPGAVAAAGSQPPEATVGPHDQAVMGPRTSEVSADANDRELPGPALMEIDAPDPPGGSEPSSVRYTTSTRSSTRPRPGTWRSTSCCMRSSSPPGSYVTTSKPIGSRWCLHTH
jgi:hypothetical protein